MKSPLKTPGEEIDVQSIVLLDILIRFVLLQPSEVKMWKNCFYYTFAIKNLMRHKTTYQNTGVSILSFLL